MKKVVKKTAVKVTPKKVTVTKTKMKVAPKKFQMMKKAAPKMKPRAQRRMA